MVERSNLARYQERHMVAECSRRPDTALEKHAGIVLLDFEPNRDGAVARVILTMMYLLYLGQPSFKVSCIGLMIIPNALPFHTGIGLHDAAITYRCKERVLAKFRRAGKW